MSRFTRRGRMAPGPVLLVDDDSTDRRAFLRRSGGYAAAAAVPVALIGATDADATASRPANGVAIKDPTTPQPDEPLMAYVHDAKAGTVVIMTGTTQRTVKDRELVRRLTTVTKKKPKAKKRRAKRKPAKKPTTSKKG
ncbi:hypothetical protein [Patulibacter minatonensis]|uniref:hypothetical protein n=1 Tax=Patulibacter minatonensis TaxID=298163 RepID=UPI0012F9E645|nr:hypothetical protein [Patulibacter minatonensis]